MARKDINIPETLRRLRREHRLSLRDVADKAGISVATLSRVETNKQSVDVELLLTLADVFSVRASEILGEDDGRDDGRSLGRQLEQLRLPERVKSFLQTPKRRGSKPLAQTLDVLLSTIDLLRTELMNAGQEIERRRKRDG